jgi:hypothetical protein
MPLVHLFFKGADFAEQVLGPVRELGLLCWASAAAAVGLKQCVQVFRPGLVIALIPWRLG